VCVCVCVCVCVHGCMRACACKHYAPAQLSSTVRLGRLVGRRRALPEPWPASGVGRSCSVLLVEVVHASGARSLRRVAHVCMHASLACNAITHHRAASPMRAQPLRLSPPLAAPAQGGQGAALHRFRGVRCRWCRPRHHPAGPKEPAGQTRGQPAQAVHRQLMSIVIKGMQPAKPRATGAPALEALYIASMAGRRGNLRVPHATIAVSAARTQGVVARKVLMMPTWGAQGSGGIAKVMLDCMAR